MKDRGDNMNFGYTQKGRKRKCGRGSKNEILNHLTENIDGL